MSQPPMNRSRNQGFVLVTSLIFLIVLSLLGVMAMRSSLFEERMATNERDMSMAREFAEMALRDAERDIMGLRFDGTTYCGQTGAACTGLIRPAGTRPISTLDSGNFWIAANPVIDDIALEDGGVGEDEELQGLFNARSSLACGNIPVWSGAEWQDGAQPPRSCAGTINAAVPTIAYGRFTDAPFNAPGVTRPRYLIEMFKADDLGISPPSNKLFFRITAVGFGRTSDTANGRRTSVTLQTVFSPL